MIGGRRRTGREVVVHGHRFRPSMRQLAVLALAGSAVTGCATFGTNIKGSFTCAAPEGICAPSSVIDDRALAMIAGEQSGMTPAGPYHQDDGVIGPNIAGAQVARTGPKVLKIVFPSYVDAHGRFHETSIVRAVVDNGAWVAATAERGPVVAGAERLRIDQPSPTAEMAYAAEAPAAAPPPSSPRDLPAPEKVAAARELAKAAATTPAAPTPAASAPSAPAKPGAPVTREAIAADVTRVLSSTTPRNRPASFPGKVEE